MSEEEEEDIESEVSESDDDSDVDAENSSGTESDASGASEIRKKEEDAKRKTSLLKRKHKQLKQSAEKKKVKLDTEESVAASTSSSKKLKKKSKKAPNEKNDDAEKAKAVESDISKPTTSSGEKPATGEITTIPVSKRESHDFSDKNVDYDLFKDDPTRVIQKRCKLSKDVVMSCKMITVNQPKLSFDYAAVVFARKGKADKAFEFNLPLELAPRIISALNLFMKDNPRFFEKYSIPS